MITIKKIIDKANCLFYGFSKYRYIMVAFLVTMATFSLTDYLKNYLQNESSFSKSFKSADYILYDCYESVEADNPVGVINPNVVIIQDDECNRLQLAALIQAVDKLSPSSIGIDHIFVESQPYDTVLVNAINNCSSPVVMASNISFNTEYQEYTTISACAFFDSLENASWGITNLGEPSVSPQNIIRRHSNTYIAENGYKMNSFSCELACRSGLFSADDNKINASSFIHYRGLSTEIIEWTDVLRIDNSIKSHEIESFKESIKGKIVLIGCTRDRGDMHLIPSEKAISGVEIHAASIYTLANNKYVRETPAWINNTIAFICVYLFSLLLYYASQNLSRIGNLCVRIVQSLFIILFIIIGYVFYRNEQNPIYIDFSSSILMVGISSFVFDIIRGVYGLFLSFRNHKK